MDASDHRTIKPDGNYKPVTFRKIDLPKDVVAYVSGGDNIGVVLARDGEVWTWGKVIGEHTPNAFWGPNNTPIDPKYKVIDKPWQLSIADSADSTAK
jgi:alpha-tubulin suppressor-like RCC1 family protein